MIVLVFIYLVDWLGLCVVLTGGEQVVHFLIHRKIVVLGVVSGGEVIILEVILIVGEIKVLFTLNFSCLNFLLLQLLFL